MGQSTDDMRYDWFEMFVHCMNVYMYPTYFTPPPHTHTHTHTHPQALYVSERLDAGTVFINTYNKTNVEAPFGGFKQSGFGKDLGENIVY